MSSADVALLAVSGAVTVCSLALVVTSVRLQRRPSQSGGGAKPGEPSRFSDAAPPQEVSRESHRSADVGSSQEVAGDSPRTSGLAPSQKRIMLTPNFEGSMRSLDKSSQSRLFVYITRLANGTADPGQLHHVSLPQGGYVSVLSIRLDGNPFQIVFSTTGSANMSELLLVDLLPGSTLVSDYARPQAADKNMDFDAIIDSSFTRSEKEILRAATEADL